MTKKAIVLVLDGFGVGEMADTAKKRPQDKGANTFKNVLLARPAICLPNLTVAGAMQYFLHNQFVASTLCTFSVSFGRAWLAHQGADSYIGHQEIAGTKPAKPIRQFVREVKSEVMHALKMHNISSRWKDKLLWVDDTIVVADNIETDYGLNINVVGSIDHSPFSFIEEVGTIVRSIVKTGRVITMGGTGVTKSSILMAFEERTRDGFTAWGINIPKLAIYNDTYHVIHMGYGADPELQIPQILTSNGVAVSLIGKTADVIRAKGATYIPQVDTTKILTTITDEMNDTTSKFIFANIQQTDLAGHEQKVDKYANYLEVVDAFIPTILKKMKTHDLFLITGDHGNDPTIGHTNHTREKTPIMLFYNGFASKNLGERKTLADIGSSIASFFSVPSPQFGTPFL